MGEKKAQILFPLKGKFLHISKKNSNVTLFCFIHKRLVIFPENLS